MTCFSLRPFLRSHPTNWGISSSSPSHPQPSNRNPSTDTNNSALVVPPTLPPIRHPPPEDLTISKRRVVLIHRQPSFTPISLSVGFKSRTGWQPLTATRHNQDSLVVLLPVSTPASTYSLFAVFDGHGRAGHRVASFVAQAFANHFRTTLSADLSLPLPVALRRACARARTDLLAHPTLDTFMTGTTVAAVAIHRRTLVCANIGDSRVVLSTLCNGHPAPLPLTNDHVPADRAERERVELAGGRVDAWSPAGIDTGPPRVWLKERRLPGLALTRSIGDAILDGIVTPEPELTIHQLTSDDHFLIVATDGIWSVMSNLDVVEFVHRHHALPSQIIAEKLVRHAAQLWVKQCSETIDDITAIVVRLQ